MITFDKSLNWMQELTRVKTAFERLMEFYWVREQDKLNLEVWKRFKFVDKRHIDLLVRFYQDNWITADKDLFNLKTNNGDKNTRPKGANTSINKTVNTKWRLETNKKPS